MRAMANKSITYCCCPDELKYKAINTYTLSMGVSKKTRQT